MERPTLGIDWSTIPIEPNPYGALPNFKDPPSLAPAVLAVGLSLTIVSMVVVSLRLFTNWRYTGRWCLDDCKSATPGILFLLAEKFCLQGSPDRLTFPDLCLFAEIGAIGYWAIVQSCQFAYGPTLSDHRVTAVQLRASPDTHGICLSTR